MERDLQRERYDLDMERIEGIYREQEKIAPSYRTFFQRTAKYLLQVKDIVTAMEDGSWDTNSMEQWKKLNYDLYEDLMPKKMLQRQEAKGYEESFANPSYAVNKLGEIYGPLLCFLYTELRGCIAFAFEQRLFDIVIELELFIEIFNLMEEESEDTPEEIKKAIYYYVSDYCDITMPDRVKEMLDTDRAFATDIIMKSDLKDLRYLYKYGEYISENEIKIATYLNSLPQDEIDHMAFTYTEGFRKGFIAAGIDLSKKEIVNIRYEIGFERMVRAAILQFEKMGLRPAIYRSAVRSVDKRQQKVGYHGTSVNRQYDYDHRFDQAIYLDKKLAERKLVNLRLGYEEMEEFAAVYAGPAVIETFGEETFTPENKKDALCLSEKQQKIQREYQRDSSLLVNDFIPSDQFSFTIIAYPVPEIGEQFEEIFAETVKVNTLDSDVYAQIQQKIIDVLDKGDYVKVLGKGANKTHMTVQLQPLNNPEKETKFENCVADVNIPVGEVFTSPQLEGTFGLLHVTEVYLNGLKYKDLELEFADGKVVAYSCKNFSKDGEPDTQEIKKQNMRFVYENLLYQRDTLPIGEFAIGTNTTAYVMAKKYNISHKLPILIAEKTGPHFAIGDTCYSMSEENRIYNPDGKEMIAKDNSCSILRKTNMEQAYFNCHTDITIPYNELQEITVYTKDGQANTILRDGRFVLEGTEALNVPLEEKKLLI